MAKGITYPVVVDADHVVTELYAISNVPTVVLINEDDTIAIKDMCDKLDDSRSMFSELGSKGMLRAVCTHMKEKLGVRQVTIYSLNQKTVGGDREAIAYDRIAMDAEMLEIEENKLPSASCKWGKNFVGHCVMERCVCNFEDVLSIGSNK